MRKPGQFVSSVVSPRSLTRPGAKRTALTATASVASPLVVTYFFHSDHLGTRKVKTNHSGTVVETWDSYPYEEQWVAGSPGDQHRFTGHLRDSESGNDYTGARYYSNNRGRWLSTDPELGDWTNPQRLNRYVYVLNDPISYVDRDGRQECLALVCVQVVGTYPSIGSSRWVFGERTRAVPAAVVLTPPGPKGKGYRLPWEKMSTRFNGFSSDWSAALKTQLQQGISNVWELLQDQNGASMNTLRTFFGDAIANCVTDFFQFGKNYSDLQCSSTMTQRTVARLTCGQKAQGIVSLSGTPGPRVRMGFSEAITT